MLNLHKAVGNYCDIEEKVQLLDNDELQNRFIALWEKLEDYFSERKSVAFELLNEVRNVDPEKWNVLAEKTVTALRRKNKTRKIIIGSTCWNSVNTLYKLKVFDDENVIAGQGTIALEIINDLDNIDAIVVPIGGGGLI